MGLAAAWLVLADLHLPAAPIHFNRDVLPILTEHCLACHGFDAAARKAGLRLDKAEDSRTGLKSGRHAIVPFQPAASELIDRKSTRLNSSHT